MSKEIYYGIALMLSEDHKNVCCVIQEGTGNTVETSNLTERWFSYLMLTDIIEGFVDEDDYIRPQRYFRIEIVHEANRLTTSFFPEEETDELRMLFDKPDYFEDFDGDDILVKE